MGKSALLPHLFVRGGGLPTRAKQDGEVGKRPSWCEMAQGQEQHRRFWHIESTWPPQGAITG